MSEEYAKILVRSQGDGCFCLSDMTESDLLSLLRMIKGAGLEERRDFDGVKRQIEKMHIGLKAVTKAEEPLVRLRPDAILKRRIKKKEFNKRVWGILEKLNVETLGDILQISEDYYLKQWNFGKKSMDLLRKYVGQFGFELKKNCNDKKQL